MDSDEVSILRKERDFIVKEVVRSEKFGDVVYELKDKGVLQDETAIYILNFEGTKTAKTHNLLAHLEKGPSQTFKVLIEVLVMFGLFKIVNRLDPRAFETYGDRILGGEMDILDAERMPDMLGVGEPFPNLPQLPGPLPLRHSASRTSIESDRNGNPGDVNIPLKVNVTPARVYGGGHMPQSELYRNQSMPRGLVFLANYKNFLNDEHPVREGSEIDVKNLSLLFAQMGYKVPSVHMNLSKYSTIKALRDFKNLEELESVDSCIVVIMSHGRDDKSFYTSDNQFLTVNHVVEKFSNLECPALNKKPKIFIFQYCRGSLPDRGVQPVPQMVKGDGGMKVATDAAYTSVVNRDPTFSDMYIVYSTVEGYVSFRHPERGSWLMEAICNVFMKHAHDCDLDTLMKKVSRQVRENLTDEGNKQVCEYVQRGFDLHFFFNPQPLNSTERLSMRALSYALSDSYENLEGAASPIPHTPQNRHHQLRRLSWSRGHSPDPVNSIHGRHRNLSGASNSSDHYGDEHDPSVFGSGGNVFHPRIRHRSANQRHSSEALHLPQQGLIPSHLECYNRSFSENHLGSQASTPESVYSSSNDTFVTATQATPPSSQLSLDMVDHHRVTHNEQEMQTEQPEKSDTNGAEGQNLEEMNVHRNSIKRQLSFPSPAEALINLNEVKKFLQVHDSDEQTIQRLERVESFVNKKKYAGKRRKKENESNSLEY